MRQKLLKLRQEMDDYQDSIAARTKNVNLNKVNYREEINYKMDTLNYCPQEILLKDAYLVVLNSRVTHPCEVPTPSKVFECNGNVNLHRHYEEVSTEFQKLELRPQQDIVYQVGGDRLPQPMKRIMGKCEQESAIIEGQAQVLCLTYKVSLGESQLEKWNVVTGQKRNNTFDMMQPEEEYWRSTPSSEISIPWEPSYSNSIHE